MVNYINYYIILIDKNANTPINVLIITLNSKIALNIEKNLSKMNK